MKLMCICDKWEDDGYPAPKFGEECEPTSVYVTLAGRRYYTLIGYPQNVAYEQRNFVQIDTDIVEAVEEKEMAA